MIGVGKGVGVGNSWAGCAEQALKSRAMTTTRKVTRFRAIKRRADKLRAGIFSPRAANQFAGVRRRSLFNYDVAELQQIYKQAK
jgi:hypothetical protein